MKDLYSTFIHHFFQLLAARAIMALRFIKQSLLLEQGFQVLPFILLMNTMTQGVSLHSVLSLCLLMILQKCWLQGFSTRSINYMLRWWRLYVKIVSFGGKMVFLSSKAEKTPMSFTDYH